MFQLLETRIVRTKHADIAPGVDIPDEGIALVWTKANGKSCVQPSAGVAGEVFAGVSLSRSVPPLFVPKVEEGIVPAGGRVKLFRAPKNGELLVKIAGQAVTDIVSAPAADGTEVELLNGIDLQFHASSEGKKIVIQYHFVPTVEEARLFVGDRPLGGAPSASMGVIGRVQDGDIGTNYFDTSKDWSDVLFAKLGADGKFVPGTQADHIPNVVVKNSPNGANPFLSLSINAA